MRYPNSRQFIVPFKQTATVAQTPGLMSCSSISSSSLIVCPPCHPQLSCSVSTEGSEGGGGKHGEGGGGASRLHPWQPVWLACSSLDDTGCCCSLLGLPNPLDCCIKTITWLFAPFQLYNVASLLEEAINNKEGGGRWRTIKQEHNID